MGSAIGISDFCDNMNKVSIELQNASEVISDAETKRALAYAKRLPIRTAGDVLLFCASINLMNAYVKQGDHKSSFGYFFKGYVRRLLRHLESNPIQDVNFFVTSHEGMSLVLVTICNLQFSYHGIPVSKTEYYNDNTFICFDGVHRQPCASTLFNMSEKNPFLSEKRLPKPVSLLCPMRQQGKAVKTKSSKPAPETTQGGKSASSSSWKDDLTTVTIWKDNPALKRQGKKRAHGQPMPLAGDTVLCEVTRVSGSSIHVNYNGFRGLIPYSEIPDEWDEDVHCFIEKGDKIDARVLTANPSGFLKLSLNAA